MKIEITKPKKKKKKKIPISTPPKTPKQQTFYWNYFDKALSNINYWSIFLL